MKMTDAFPSNYLRAADFPKPTLATMSYVKMEDIGDDHKPVLYFAELDKGLVLNKTNGNTIADAYGDDTENWKGEPIVLFETQVQFQSRMVAAIRVRKPKTQIQSEVKPKKSATAPPPISARVDMDDDIPFEMEWR